MTRCSNPRKVQQWQQRMARFENSKQSVVRFCQGEGVSVPSFYKWRKKLQQVASATEASEDAADRFTPVRLVGSAGVAVRLPGGTQLDIPAANPQLLQMAIQTLAHADAQRQAGGETC